MALAKETTTLAGVVVLTPPLFEDERGSFFESYSKAAFEDAVGSSVKFIQDNVSRSRRGVIRGLHFQLEPNAQGKLVRCARGAIWDVAVDVTVGSTQIGEWIGVHLSEENRRQLWIPEGFAHGFIALSDVAEVQYKATSPYVPQAEASIVWSDPSIGIAWPVDEEPIVSDKDAAAPSFEDAMLMGVRS